MFHPYLDAANLDLKAFREKTYNHFVGAGLQPVLDNMKHMKKLGIWLEVTTLVISDLDDDPAELRDAARFIAQELGVDTPWHISRFFPAYNKMMDVPPRRWQPCNGLEKLGWKKEYITFTLAISRKTGVRIHFVQNAAVY